MTEAEALVGASYGALATSPIFEGRVVPERELIVDQSYVSEPSLGISFVLPGHEVISSVQLHAEGHEAFRQFEGPLPAGLSFDMSQDQVRAHLGEPEMAGVEMKVPILGDQPAWDKYLIEGRRVHIRYGFDRDSIVMVSLSANGPN